MRVTEFSKMLGLAIIATKGLASDKRCGEPGAPSRAGYGRGQDG